MFLEITVAATLAAGELPRDRWFGEDKLRHFFASLVVTSISASAARAAGFDHDQSLAAGVGVGVAAGVWKEIRDHRRPGGSASVRDLVWDLAGVAAAAAVFQQGRSTESSAQEEAQPER
jgi:uncharacterized protein YfiM (DUF2279 family)